MNNFFSAQIGSFAVKCILIAWGLNIIAGELSLLSALAVLMIFNMLAGRVV